MAGKARDIRSKPEPDPRFQVYTQPHNTSEAVLPASGGGIKTPINYYMKSKGGIFTGAIGHTEDSLDISSGVLDLTDDSTGSIKIRGVIHLNPESGTTDTLDAIELDGNELPYQELTIIGIAGDTITITHDFGSATGTQREILCPSNSDYTLSGDESVDLIFDSSLSKWVITGGSSGSGAGGGGSLNFPVEPTVSDEGNTTGAKTIDLSSGDGHVWKMTLTGDVTLSFSNYPTSGEQREWELEIVQDSTGGHSITMPSEVVETVNIAETADTTTILTFRTNDGGSNVHVIPALRGTIDINGAFLPLAGGTMLGVIDMNSNDIVFASGGMGDHKISTLSNTVFLFANGSESFRTNTDLIRFAKELQIRGNQLTLDADDDTYIDSATDDTIKFYTGGFDRVHINNTETQFQGGHHLDMNGNNVYFDVDGDTYITNNGDDVFEVYAGGALQLAINTTEIDIQSNDLIIGAGGSGDNKISSAGASVLFFSDGTEVFRYTSTLLRMAQLLDMNGNNIDNFNNIISNATTPSTNGVIRLGIDEAIGWKNNAGTLDHQFRAQNNGGTDEFQMLINAAIEWQFSDSRMNCQGNGIEDVDYVYAGTGTRASQGFIRMRFSDEIGWRNNGNTKNMLIGVNTDDEFTFNSPINLGGEDFILTTPSSDSKITTVGNTVLFFSNGSEAFRYTNTLVRMAQLLDMDGNTLEFDTDQQIVPDAGGLTYKVPTSDTHDFEVNSTSVMEITGSDINVAQDLDMANSTTVDWATTQSTVGSAGAASALPANPTGYVIIKVNGTEFVTPYYAKT